MAKISANGDSAYARWSRTSSSPAGAPHEMLLTAQGRLLYKQMGGRFKLRRRGVTFGQACAQAAIFRMRVPSR